MPEEIFILSMLTVVSGTFLVMFVVSKIAAHAKSKQESSSGSGTLRTSELETMLRRIVREEVNRSELGVSDDGSGEERFLSEHLDADELFDDERESRPRVRRQRND
jgi:hypothetical protein